MRLRVSRTSADERLTHLLAAGYRILQGMQNAKRDGLSVRTEHDALVSTWGSEVLQALLDIFPTDLENNAFNNADFGRTYFSGPDQPFQEATERLKAHLSALDRIRAQDVGRCTDLPLAERLYVEDIDSFHKVRDVNPGLVASFLTGGFLDLAEDRVQIALEQILEVSFHKKDWAGELNDLYTANVVVSGARRATAFLLKGPGIGRKEMTISDCGKNGDQLVRLFASPAELFVVQYVGPIAEAVILDALGKVRERRTSGKDGHLLVIDGQDTARMLLAYGKLQSR
jgi:hypothetical protein